MTVVGAVEVTVSATVNQNTITKQMSDGLQRPATTAGQAAGRTMGRHIGESAAGELEKSGARFARSGRLLSNVFTSNSAAALGPLQEVADKVDLIGTTLDQTKTKAGGLLLGIGAAATGVGAFLSTLASREEAATNRLAASITAAGGNIDDYRDRIDKAVKSGEKFGQSGNQTIDAIQALTIGLHDPKKALDELGLAEDIAAAKQISLSSAANLVRQAYNGNTRVLKAFGIQVADVVDGQKLLADAHTTATKAAADVTKAQQSYTDKLAIYRDTLKPTLSQQIALQEAHDKLTTATAAQAAAQQGLADAQKKANAAGGKGQEVLDKLAQITAGQASASAETFTGHLKQWGARIEDVAAGQGKLGHVLVTSGPLIAAAGAVVETGLTIKMIRAAKAATAMRDAQVIAATEGSAAMEGAAAKEVLALEGVTVAEGESALAAEGMSSRVLASMARMLGPIAVVTAAVIGIKDAFDAIENRKQTGAVFKSKAEEITQDYADGLISKDEASKLIKQALLHPDQPLKLPDRPTYDPRTPDDYDAKASRGRRAVDASIAAAAKAGAPKPAPTQTLDQFLASIGGGSVASSAANKALSDAQKTAGDHARAIGKQVTDGIKAQVATVKHGIAELNTELKKISDTRAQAISQAASFSSITGLLPDNSLATSGALVAGLQSRVGAEQLFGRNLTSLSKRGLDKGVISEILAAGPEQARSIAAALAAGGNDQIRALNAAEKASRQQAQVLGQDAVTAQFGAGTQARANAELAKLNAQVATLNKQIAAQPALIAKAVDQAQHNAQVSKTARTRTSVSR